jgi:DNA polymerase III epsilon subunit-like protein
MIYNSYCVYDLETTSPNPRKTQMVQIAAVMVNSRTLSIVPGSEFESLVQPSFDPEFCELHNLDLLQPGAVAVHGKTEAMLRKAPSLKSVWNNFCEYVNEYNYKGTNWSAPIAVGYNNKSFDNRIIERVMCDEPWAYGPCSKDKTRAELFNKYYSLDVIDMMIMMFENDKKVNKMSADALIRGHMGYAKGEAHDAMGDVKMTAELFCKTQRSLRAFAKTKNFEGMMA